MGTNMVATDERGIGEELCPLKELDAEHVEHCNVARASGKLGAMQDDEELGVKTKANATTAGEHAVAVCMPARAAVDGSSLVGDSRSKKGT